MKHRARTTTFCISKIDGAPLKVFVGRKAIALVIWRTMLLVSPVREIPMNVTGRARRPDERMVLINLRS
jgi:hypothetical protein